MSKASRRQQRQAKIDPATGASSAGASRPSDASRTRGVGSDAPTRPSTSPVGTPRVGRTRRPTYERSFSERYRTVIIAAVAIVGVGLIGAFVFAGASRAAYTCTSQWVPTQTPAPPSGSSPQPGYVQDDMGNEHTAPGGQVRYTLCPPASGDHYNGGGVGPILARFYGPEDKALPQGWIHNLEHGGLVLLYRGDGPGATADGQAALRAFFDAFPPSPVCGLAAGTNVSPLFARFDEMATPYAALVWDRVLPLETLDTAQILQFHSSFAEVSNPEKQCASPTPVPSPSASGSEAASPSASPSPS